MGVMSKPKTLIKKKILVVSFPISWECNGLGNATLLV
jgi:hypothetical protein